MLGLVRQEDEQGRGAFVHVDGRIRIEQIPLHEALGVPDRQAATVIQTDGKHGRTPGVPRFVGIGMIALRESHFQGHDDAIRALSKTWLYRHDVRRSGCFYSQLKYK